MNWMGLNVLIDVHSQEPNTVFLNLNSTLEQPSKNTDDAGVQP